MVFKRISAISTAVITVGRFNCNCNSSQQQKEQKKKKAVTFAVGDDPMNMNCKQISKLDQDSIWFSREQEDQFRERDSKMTTMLASKHFTATELEIKTGECPRGLEYATSSRIAKELQERRTRSVNAVMATQTLFQKKKQDKQDQDYGSSSVESIARAYRFVSDQAIQQALDRASDDAKFVEEHIRITLLTGEAGQRQFSTRDIRPAIIGRQNALRVVV